MVNPPGWMLTSVAAYPVLKNWVNPRLLTDPLHARVSKVPRLTAFIISLLVRSCQVKEWIRGRLSSQSFAERRVNRSAGSPESWESIVFFRSSRAMDLRVLSCMAFMCSMSAFDSLSGVSVCLAFGSTFNVHVLEFCFPWNISRMTCCPLASICEAPATRAVTLAVTDKRRRRTSASPRAKGGRGSIWVFWGWGWYARPHYGFKRRWRCQ
jgi:hypothetical protein